MIGLGISAQEMQVMLFDRHPNGPYMELIKKAFSPNHNIIRHEHFRGKIVRFKKLIFHLESPAGLIFPRVSIYEISLSLRHSYTGDVNCMLISFFVNIA